jgi:hypothetical protein
VTLKQDAVSNVGVEYPVISVFVALAAVLLTGVETLNAGPIPDQLNAPEPLVVSTCPLVPFPVGNTSVLEPATAGASISV